MKNLAWMVLVVASACGKADDCTRLFNATAKMMKDMPLPKGKTMGDFKDQFVSECKANPDKYMKDPTAKCILEAKSDEAAADCMKAGMQDYMHKSKESEAALQLNKLGKLAKIKAAETGAFPIGKAKVLPADNGSPGCCGGGDNKCKVSTEWASDPVWKALELQIDEPTLYRYSYESSDGKSFTATAVGDVDCDGKPATFTLTGKLDASGMPTIDLAKPAAGEY